MATYGGRIELQAESRVSPSPAACLAPRKSGAVCLGWGCLVLQ